MKFVLLPKVMIDVVILFPFHFFPNSIVCLVDFVVCDGYESFLLEPLKSKIIFV